MPPKIGAGPRRCHPISGHADFRPGPRRAVSDRASLVALYIEEGSTMFRTAAIVTAAIGIAGLMTTTVQAETLRSYATDFSSQNNTKKKTVTTTRTTTVVRQAAPVRPAPRVIKQQTTTIKNTGVTNNAVFKQKTTV